MKKKIALFLILTIVGVGAYFGYEKYFKEKQESVIVDDNKNTEVLVINETKDTVCAYLTLGSDTNYVTNVNGIFGITLSGLQGFFFLAPNDTVSYKSPVGKGFSGNITFGTPPINCPDTLEFPYGINIFECSLNNGFASVPNAQETIDISCVSGVNSKIACSVSDSNWNAGDTVGVMAFENSYIYDNVGRIGVYPFGCDTCTGSKAPPVCVPARKYSQPQSKSICNVQRDATKKGGKVIVKYKGVLNGEILK
jgi:hypothetical protein